MSLRAQQPFWDYHEVTGVEYEHFSPHVAFDRWGNTHLMWASRDPRHAGLQLFYSNNVTGRFAAPVQVSDTGTVFDSSSSGISTFNFLLDSAGIAHVAFVANVRNHLQLFYTTNSAGAFAPAQYVGDLTRFSMAIDSAGRAHVVTVEEAGGWFNILYWNSVSGDNGMIGSIRCTASSTICRVGDVETEISPRGVEIVVCADSASVYHMRWSFSDGASGVTRLPIPAYDARLTWMGQADRRMRMATDVSGALHVAVPRYSTGSGYRLLYANNAGGVWTLTQATADTILFPIISFDLATNDVDRLGLAWSAPRRFTPSLPMSSVVEYVKTANRWTFAGTSADIGAIAADTVVARNASSIAVFGSRIAVAGLALPDTLRDEVVGLFERGGLRPTISYLIPDAAAAGMNVVVEAIAPYHEKGAFGPDGFRRDTVSMRLVNPRDSLRVIVGPSVVSWQGRLVSTMLFVRPGASPGPVPVTIRVGSATSSVDTFFVVAPQHLGDSTGVLRGGGVLGSGGEFGRRSRRGVLVVDSLILASGTWRIDTSDCDPQTRGNQGYLPVTILSAGPILIDSVAELTASAAHDPIGARFGDAGPGGGGGGSGGWIDAGSGYTGGGGPGRFFKEVVGASEGSGTQNRSSRYGGGPSINGAPAGIGVPDGPGGGGVGHPFGASGTYGRMSENDPTRADAGGYGGGTAGSRDLQYSASTTGGGGGGNSLPGISGNERGQESNGGWIVGSRCLVPLAGGSGGGGGGFATEGVANGGGGGGALSLVGFSRLEIRGTVSADGAQGVNAPSVTNASGGGGGAGGGILLSSKAGVRLDRNAHVTAQGGPGGQPFPSGGRPGGAGGAGRVRLDGRLEANILTRPEPSIGYSGPATGMNGLYVGREGTRVRGFGEPGARVRVFVKPDKGRWDYARPYDAYVGSDSTWSIRLGPEAGDGYVYIAAMQQGAPSGSSEFASEPAWIMSAAGGNILGQPLASISAAGHDFGCIPFGTSDSAVVWVRNTAAVTDLEIRDIRLSGAGSGMYRVDRTASSIAPGDSLPLLVHFIPGTIGRFDAVMTIVTNAWPDAEKAVALGGCAVTGDLSLEFNQLDLGTICVGDCRDTVIRLSNTGNSVLHILDIHGDESKLDVEVLDSARTIEPGASIVLRMRVCVRAFDSNLHVTFETDTEEQREEMLVLARNGRPRPAFDSLVVFPEIDLAERPVRCSEKIVYVHNLRPDLPLVITGASIAPAANFTILAVPLGVPVPPLDSIALRISFCATVAGTAAGVLSLQFDQGYCLVDSTIALVGRANVGSPRPVVVRPEGTHLLQFATRLVGGVESVDSVVVHNFGNVDARLMPPVLEPVAGTSAADIYLMSSAWTFPLSLAPGASAGFPVAFLPQSTGPKQAMIILRSEDGQWLDTVNVTGLAVQPGLQLELTQHDFGAVRLGDTSTSFVLTVINSGTAADSVRDVVPDDQLHFQRTGAVPTLPSLLSPGDTLRFSYVYIPTSESADAANVSVALGSGGSLAAQFTGRGAIERAVPEPPIVDFGAVRRNAVVDRPIAFRIRNAGSWPLAIDSLRITSGNEYFQSIGAWAGGDTIRPGSMIYYGIQFQARRFDARGTAMVWSSAGVSTVELRGTIQPDPVLTDVVVQNAAGLVGEHVEIPILLTMADTALQELAYSFTLTFDPGLVAPRTPGRPDALLSPITAGTMSSDANWSSVEPGRLTITGTLRAGSLAGELVRIPVKVLLGPPTRSQVTVSAPALSPGLFTIRTMPGMFYGIDCDTGRAVIAKGVYGLAQNSPNPFNPTTEIVYSVAAREHVKITLYNSTGTQSQILVDEVKDPGVYRLMLDARQIGSGVYTYEMVSGPFRAVRRMIVLE